MFSHVWFFRSSSLCIICQDPRICSGVYRPKYKNLRTSRLSRSAHVPDPGQVRNGYGRARGVWAALRGRRSNEAIWPRILVARIACWGRDGKKAPHRIPPPKNDHRRTGIYLYKPFFVCLSDYSFYIPLGPMGTFLSSITAVLFFSLESVLFLLRQVLSSLI